ncbi:MAG: helix-turn-helix domain-containing protein [Candidatus Diapherotrites archaeon]|nr:helix-turn-helix domain-containing protein [Candidatus Diapherotrites archaeon]
MKSNLFKETIWQLIFELNAHGFTVADFSSCNVCFDLLAKKDKSIFVIKVFANIDALHESQAVELKKIAAIFNAVLVLVGLHTKKGKMKKGIIYERYGIACIAPQTFFELIRGKEPIARYTRGKTIARLDSKKLKKLMKEKKISIEDLAMNIGISIETVWRYKHGYENVSLANLKKLEGFFDESLAKPIEIPNYSAEITYEEEINDEALSKLHKLGSKVFVFYNAPFRAHSQSTEQKNNSLLVARCSSRTELKKKAPRLRASSRMLNTLPLIIGKKLKEKNVAGSAVVAEEELLGFSRFDEFVKFVKERLGANNE